MKSGILKNTLYTWTFQNSGIVIKKSKPEAFDTNHEIKIMYPTDRLISEFF